MTDTDRSGKLSRRDAVAVFAGGAAFGVDAALAGAIGGTGAALLAVDSANASPAVVGPASTLAKLAAEHFEPLVGQPFTIDGQQVKLQAVRRGPATPSRFRKQFAVTFAASQALSGAGEPVSVAHPAIGQHGLLVTEAIGRQGRTLEICFG